MDTVNWRSLLPQHRMLQELVRLNDEVAATTGCPDPFDAIGLMLDDKPYRYDKTPKNAIPFATTGGDSCHYSLLALDDHAPDAYPIVLTVHGAARGQEPLQPHRR